jgi:uncharacterized protein
VIGEGEIKAVPDEVRLMLGVHTGDASLSGAKTQNDERYNKVLAIARKYGIPPADITTDYLSVSQENVIVPNIPSGYSAHRSLMILLRDLTKLERLTAELMETGVNMVSQTDFRTSAAEKLFDQARVAAMRSAKQKAALLAKEANRTVGKAVIINDGYGQQMNLYSALQSGASLNSLQSGQAAAGGGYGTTLGQISIRAVVTVTYQLE